VTTAVARHSSGSSRASCSRASV